MYVRPAPDRSCQRRQSTRQCVPSRGVSRAQRHAHVSTSRALSIAAARDQQQRCPLMYLSAQGTISQPRVGRSAVLHGPHTSLCLLSNKTTTFSAMPAEFIGSSDHVGLVSVLSLESNAPFTQCPRECYERDDRRSPSWLHACVDRDSRLSTINGPDVCLCSRVSTHTNNPKPCTC